MSPALRLAGAILLAGTLAACGATSPSTAPSPGPATVTVTAPTPPESSSTVAPREPSPTDDPNWITHVVDAVRSGVVRLQVAGCDGEWMGTGFLVDSRTIVTAGHVARNAVSISASGRDGIARASVVAYDMSADTAVLRTQVPLRGHHFSIDDQPPPQGESVLVLGFPFAVDDLRLSDGLIGSGDIDVTYPGTEDEDGFTVDHIVTTNAAVNGGSSGGPALSRSGAVVGLVSGGRDWSGSNGDAVPAQGDNYLVPSNVIAAKLAEWRSESLKAPSTCGEEAQPPVDADHQLEVDIQSGDDAAHDIAQALFTYGDSINQGYYGAAWSVMTSTLQDRNVARFGSVEGWASELDSSFWDTLTLHTVDRVGDAATVGATFRTRQDPEYGDGRACSDYDATFSMVHEDGSWLIDGIRAATPASCD